MGITIRFTFHLWGTSVTHVKNPFAYIFSILFLTTLFFIQPVEARRNRTIASVVSISPASVNLVVGSSQTFSASGGVSPYIFTASAGSFANTSIYTAPSVAGAVTVTVKDANLASASAKINVYSKLQIGSSSMSLNVGTTYSIVASGGLTPYSYSLTGVGSLSGSTYSTGSATGTATITIMDALKQQVSLTVMVVAPVTSTPPPTTSTTQINAAGMGVTSVLTPNCTPAIRTDFMDVLSWTSRRVEPGDCNIVRIATPIFSWPLPIDLNASLPMNLAIRRPSDGYSIARSTTRPRVLLADTTLASGQYEWTVSYTNKNGLVVTSQARRFSISSDASVMKLPTGISFAATVANKSRPRALPTGTDFATIASKAQNGEYKVQYAAFLAKANTLLTAAVPTPPANLTRADFTSDLTYTQWLLSLAKAANDELTAIETLGYAGKFTGNTAFDNMTVTHVMSLAAWPTDGATSETVQDQANTQIYLALGMGLDLLQTKLTSTQRSTIVTALKARLTQAMARYAGLDSWPYNSHVLDPNVVNVTETLMYSVGTPEFPEANAMLVTAWETLATMLGTWGGGSDGAFANSDAYGWFFLNTVARTASIMKLVAGLDITKWPAVGHYGDNQIAMTTATGYMRGQFGDAVESNDHYRAYSFSGYRLFASATGRPENEWYWRANPSNLTIQISLQPIHYLMLGISTPVAPLATPAIADSFVFEDAGLVAMHSKTTDTARSSLFFRSSRFGSFNHSHADNNAFTFVSKGKEIFISGGYYPYYLSPHHALVGRATRFKNALTFNGGIGQAEPVAAPTAPGAPIMSMDTRGQLINFGDNGTWAYTTGDATLAYRGQDPTTKAFTPLLTKAVRSVAYNRQERVAVIYDWATSATAKTWELNFQSLVLPTLVGSTIHVNNGGVESCMDVYGPAGSIAITNGFPIAPEVTQPDQFHTRYSVTTASTQLVSVTVIREDCRAVPVSVSYASTAATVVINNGSSMVFDQKTIKSP